MNAVEEHARLLAFLDTEGAGGCACLRRAGHKGPHQAYYHVWEDVNGGDATAAEEVSCA